VKNENKKTQLRVLFDNENLFLSDINVYPGKVAFLLSDASYK